LTHILITNDDGIDAPGLLALAQALTCLGKVTVLAPDHNWSASGHVKTMHRPLRVKETLLADGTKAYKSDGAPSDCVALALLGFVDEKIDMVVSGINPNANIGHDVTYSGTVTAAMEAAIWGIPGLAFSLDLPPRQQGKVDYSHAAVIARQITAVVAQHGLPKNILLNVNIPYVTKPQEMQFQITRQGLRLYRDALDARLDPRGRPYYWIGGDAPTGVPDEGTDFGELARNMVSITPLHLDLTAYEFMSELNSWDFRSEPAS
jgi:5'-nucleotidase